ncbi:MAG: hypothetical protein F6K48_16330 [Okeania sp. SIO3H1]|nr:hypothetical protein [Okeania sp. SIO3H1]
MRISQDVKVLSNYAQYKIDNTNHQKPYYEKIGVIKVSEVNQEENQRNPYEKILTRWDEELKEIEGFINDIKTSSPELLSYVKQVWFHSEVGEKREKLEKIQAGVRKTTETLTLGTSSGSSNANADSNNYLERLIDLNLRVKNSIKDLSEIDILKNLQSIFNENDENINT